MRECGFITSLSYVMRHYVTFLLFSPWTVRPFDLNHVFLAVFRSELGMVRISWMLLVDLTECVDSDVSNWSYNLRLIADKNVLKAKAAVIWNQKLYQIGKEKKGTSVSLWVNAKQTLYHSHPPSENGKTTLMLVEAILTNQGNSTISIYTCMCMLLNFLGS